MKSLIHPIYWHNYSKRTLFILDYQKKKKKKNETGIPHDVRLINKERTCLKKAGHSLNFWEVFEHRCGFIRNEYKCFSYLWLLNLLLLKP